MADKQSSQQDANSNNFVYFILGSVLVIVVGMGAYLYTDSSSTKSVDIELNVPNVDSPKPNTDNTAPKE